MNQELLDAVRDTDGWMARFTLTEYSGAFREYTERFGPLYMEAVRGADGQLEPLAEEWLRGLEAEIARQRFWNRTVFRSNVKMVVIQYLSPMLIGLEEPSCKRLAELLRQGWAARWPKEAYKIASYRTLLKGFRYTLLGFDLTRQRSDMEEEEENL
jgi:hypothetical protein